MEAASPPSAGLYEVERRGWSPSPAEGAGRPLEARWLGRVPYREGLTLQETLHRQVADGQANDTLLLLEHDPVITMGRQTRPEHVLIDTEAQKRLGIEVVETGRGGDVTYHGPGQLVGYPIVALGEGERDIKAYVHRLEEILIRTAADFGIEAVRVEGLRGIWVGNDKLAAIGIRLVRWVTLHGFALNVSTDLTAFDSIVPCGLHGRGVTSFAKLCKTPPTMAAVRARIEAHASDVLHRPLLGRDQGPR